MTWDDAVNMLKEINKKAAKSEDFEEAHVSADDVLCQFIEELGYTDVVKAYREIPKQYA